MSVILIRNAIEDVETLGAGARLIASQTLDNLLAERDELREALREVQAGYDAFYAADASSNRLLNAEAVVKAVLAT